ncbi:hypothetical protein MT476_26385 (plasmid) [Bacillus sp. H8-1]|nr:hypothetical protein MT476_26385 [Bacillus sp. H8-1]
MRSVDISQHTSMPKVLIEAQEAGGETGKAIDFYSRNPNNSYPFKVYKHEEIRKELNKIFYGKCAYCETLFIHIHPVDIEHYRPKGGFQSARYTELVKPGYYWLAADRNNLLPSCIDCNRERKHLLGDNKVQKLGKGNVFPIEDESTRARSHDDDLDIEKPLLLHPYFDDPNDHLDFTIDGIVRPKTKMGIESNKGLTSIEVYGLQRPYLIKERKKLCLSIFAQISRVKLLLEKIEKYPDDEDFIENFKYELKLLLDFTKPYNPYSLMARQIINDFKIELGI